MAAAVATGCERVELLNTAPGDAVAAGLSVDMFNEAIEEQTSLGRQVQAAAIAP